MGNLMLSLGSLVITGLGIWGGVFALTGDSLAGLAFGIAGGTFAFDVVFILLRIADKK